MGLCVLLKQLSSFLEWTETRIPRKLRKRGDASPDLERMKEWIEATLVVEDRDDMFYPEMNYDTWNSMSKTTENVYFDGSCSRISTQDWDSFSRPAYRPRRFVRPRRLMYFR